MLHKKQITLITLIIFMISGFIMVFGKEILGDYIIISTMLVIVSGLVLMVLVILSKQEMEKPIQDREFSEFKEDVKKKICNICNTENKESAISCIKCGSSLIEVICPICNTVNSFDQKYCKSCDTILQNKKRH